MKDLILNRYIITLTIVSGILYYFFIEKQHYKCSHLTGYLVIIGGLISLYLNQCNIYRLIILIFVTFHIVHELDS